MKKVTIKVYEFAELSDKAKEKALEEFSDINVGYEWWDYILDEAERIGIRIEKFDISHGLIKGDFILSAAEVVANIFRDHGEACETHKTAERFIKAWQPVFDAYMDEASEHYESAESEDEMMEIESEFLRDILEDYLSLIQKDYEYLTSEEGIIESIEANEYQFTEDGSFFTL